MDSTNEQTKKCFCTRCFLPIDGDDKVDIEGQNFHKICSMCCICRTIPPSLKMFYGHVFCSDCFKTHVLTRFRGESPRMACNSWWMQWAPGAKPQEAADTPKSADYSEEPTKRHICARCLQVVNDGNKIDIGGQSFHTQCAKCYFCHTVPSTTPKIYYGQVFCEECFQRNVLGRNRDNPSEFFKTCFEQWQNNPQFADNMRNFMTGGNNTPFVFMMQGQPPFCRCGTGPQDSAWFQSSEPKNSATPAVSVGGDSVCTWDLSFENRTEVSDFPESCLEDADVVAEKIEKLTKYLHERDCAKMWGESSKKWEMEDFETLDSERSGLKDRLECPKCLWQCGPIYVNDDCLKALQ